MPLTRTEARKIALATPGASEGPYFGKPTIFVGEDYLCRVHDKEAAVVLRSGSMEMREVMLEAEPKLFYITDHYKSFPMILARLSALDKKTLKDLLAARILRIQQKSAGKRPKKPKPGRRKKKAAG
jgi:hypothetical protein